MLKYKAIRGTNEIIGSLFDIAKFLKIEPQEVVFLANHSKETIRGWKVIREQI